MSQFGGGSKNPPWARTGGAQQSSMSPAAFAAQLQTQQTLQFQQMAMQQAALQNQAMLSQPGVAMPTSLSSSNMATVSYPTLKAQQAAQQQQPKQRVFTGSITKLHENFGFVDEDVFFQTTCVKGVMPKQNDRVLVEAQYNANMPFKWNATSIKVMPNLQSGGNQGGRQFGSRGMGGPNHPKPLLDRNAMGPPGRGGRRERSDRDRPRRDLDRGHQDRGGHDHRGREKSSESTENADDFHHSKKRSRSPSKQSMSPSRKSHSPPRRRPRIMPRYMVQVPKLSLDIKEATVVTLKSRYSNMYIPSDFFNAGFPWHEGFPLTRPFQLGKPCTFHIMHKDVERVGQNSAILDPPDADHLYSAKVMLIASPSLDDLYHKSCSLSQDVENIQENFVHPTRLINFLVGVKGKNEPIAIGGPWSPSLDGESPASDPKVLIKTAIRTCKALTGINLSSCTQWYRFAEVRYLRPEESHKGKVVPARVETSVIFLPDVWSCHPTHLEWETLQMGYKKQLEKKLAQLEGKEDSQDEEDMDGELPEKKDPTHHSELDPKTMKIIDLRHELECRNISSKGLKSQLIARLTKILKTEEEKEVEEKEQEPEKEEEEPEEEPPMETEQTEEQKKKEEEERLKELEKMKATYERRYTLPEKPSIMVYPNATAKGGKFDCSVMSLSLLLDYRPEDNKEHSFEVSLFVELFNEMLMRDFGFEIYKAMCAAPEKPKEEEKKKDKKEKDKKDDDKEPSTKKKKTDESDKEKNETDKKEEKKESEKEKLKNGDVKAKEEKLKNGDVKAKEEKRGDKEKEEKRGDKEKKEKKKYITTKPQLLLSCIYFDQNHTGYIQDKDAEEIMHTLGLGLSRAQVKKMVQKVVSRDSMSYRKLTDRPLPGTDDDSKDQPRDIDIDVYNIAAGNQPMLKRAEPGTPSKKRSPGKEAESSNMVTYNGAVLDIASLLERLSRGEQAQTDMDSKLTDLTDKHDVLKKSLKRKEDSHDKLVDDLKDTRQKLASQVKMTSSGELSNQKYVSALVNSQTLLTSLVNTVTNSLGERATIKIERVTHDTQKKEVKEVKETKETETKETKETKEEKEEPVTVEIEPKK